MKDNGMTVTSIFIHVLSFPFYMLGKSEIIFKRILIKFI